MLVSHRKRFIYTKTYKTAGTSVESYFEQYCMPDGEWTLRHLREAYVGDCGIIGYRGTNSTDEYWYNHMPAGEIRDKIGDAIWREYFKFCVVRNPFDKLVSAFFFENKKGEHSVAEFRDWVKLRGFVTDRNQYVIDNTVCIDYFIRYESLAEGIAHVCGIIGVPFEPDRIQTFKSGHRDRQIALCDLYDPATIKIVQDRFGFELEHFGYGPPGGSS